MLTEWIVKESKSVKYLTIILESRLRGQPKTDGGIVYEQISKDTKLQIGKRGKKQN
jgi:hypothetical protein